MVAEGIGAARERNDVLAYLRQRQRAAEAVAARYPEDSERSRDLARQIGIQIESIEPGLHEGMAPIAGEGIKHG